MEQAPLVELQRPEHERLDHLVDIYGPTPQQDLVEATRRIGRRLGPQRTHRRWRPLQQAISAWLAR